MTQGPSLPDVNECHSSPCSQECANVYGSYQCYCRRGYQLSDVDGVTCEGEVPAPFCPVWGHVSGLVVLGFSLQLRFTWVSFVPLNKCGARARCVRWDPRQTGQWCVPGVRTGSGSPTPLTFERASPAWVLLPYSRAGVRPRLSRLVMSQERWDDCCVRGRVFAVSTLTVISFGARRQSAGHLAWVLLGSPCRSPPLSSHSASSPHTHTSHHEPARGWSFPSLGPSLPF